jgi:hypothetical protein
MKSEVPVKVEGDQLHQTAERLFGLAANAPTRNQEAEEDPDLEEYEEVESVVETS